MEMEKALKARQLLDDIGSAHDVLAKIRPSAFKLIPVSGASPELNNGDAIYLTPELRQEIRDCIRDYKDRKQKELYAL